MTQKMRKMLGKTLKIAGCLLILQSGIIVLPSLVALIYGEWYSAAGFLISGTILGSAGYLLYRLFRHADEPYSHQAILIATASWFILAIMGGLPFLVISCITPVDVMQGFIPPGAEYGLSSLFFFSHPLHCVFESVSAYTTTGYTLAVHEPSIGHGLLFYRSLANWVGGAGFIIMVVAVFRQFSGKGALSLYHSESPIQKLKPRVIEAARSIWKIYALVTLFLIVYLIIGTCLILPGYPLTDVFFDAVNHAMSGIATGGFSTLDNSIAEYRSYAMETLYLLPMIMGSFSLAFYYKIFFERKWNTLWKDRQFGALVLLFVAGSLILSLLLRNPGSGAVPFREGIFQFVSALSTTGWQTSAIDQWDNLPVLFIIFAGMFIGGASGATVGGIKMIRALIIIKGLMRQVKSLIYSEHTVKLPHFNGHSMAPEEFNSEFASALSMAVLFLIIMIGCALISILFYPSGHNGYAMLFESASAIGTVGLSAGIVDPSMPAGLEIIYMFEMLAGRLEVIPVLALIRAMVCGMR
jgi:trk system potassium uptake protein TrkH